MSERFRRLTAGFEWELFAALVLALPLMLPFFADGLPNTADAEIHLHRIISAAVDINAGYVFPRWTPYLHHGYGYPIHNFYAPGVHILGAWIYLPTHINGVIIWKLLQMGATLLYPAGAYLFARTFAGRRGALVAAAVYTCAPFRFDELWLQSNLSQFAAMALLPFLFASIARAALQPGRRNAALIGISFGIITLFHHPTGFLAAPFAGVYALWLCCGLQRQVIPGLASTLGGLILGVGISSIFWLPALAEFSFVQINSIQSGTFNAAANLIPLSDLTRPILPVDRNLQNIARFFTPGQPQLVIAFAAPIILAMVWLFQRKTSGTNPSAVDRGREQNPRLEFGEGERGGVARKVILNVLIGAIFMALCLLLMTPASTWIWENLPVARLVVYPWRLLGIAAVVAIPGAAVLPDLLPKRWQTPAAGGLIALFAFAALPLLYTPLSFYTVGELTPGEAYIYEKRTGNMGLTSGNEYLPIWATERPMGGDPRNHQVFEWRVDLYTESMAPDVIYERMIDGCSPGTTCYTLTTPQAFTLLFNQLYFPGWSVMLDQQPVEVRPEGMHGLIALDMPAGTHTLSIRYGGTPIQHFSEMLALISLLVTLSLCVRLKRASPPAEHNPASASRLAAGLVITVIGFVIVNQYVLLPSTDFMRPAGDANNPPSQHRTHVQFGDALALVGYDISTVSARPGDTVRLTLYWHLLEAATVSPRASVQLTDNFGSSVWARADSVSIAGQNFANWQPGKYATDTYTLQIQPDALPYVGQIRVSVYTQSETIEYVPTLEGADFAVLTDFRVTGNRSLVDDEALSPRHVTYDGKISLRGTAPGIHDSGQTCVILRWQVEQTGMPDYTVLLHLLDAEGNFLAAADAPPLNNLYPTSQWQSGQKLDDEHCFSVPPDAKSLAIGFYELSHPVAIPATGTGENISNNALVLPLE